MTEINGAAGWGSNSTFKKFHEKSIHKTCRNSVIQLKHNTTCSEFILIYILNQLFLDSIALKNQLTSKWTRSDIVKENFPFTKAQCVVMSDYV